MKNQRPGKAGLHKPSRYTFDKSRKMLLKNQQDWIGESVDGPEGRKAEDVASWLAVGLPALFLEQD